MTAQSQLNCLRRLQSFQCRQMTISVSQWLSPWSSFLPLAKSSEGRATLQSNPMTRFSGPSCFTPWLWPPNQPVAFTLVTKGNERAWRILRGGGGTIQKWLLTQVFIPTAAPVTSPASLQRNWERLRRIWTSGWAFWSLPRQWVKITDGNKNRNMGLSTCLGLSAPCVISHLILTTALWGKGYYSLF